MADLYDRADIYDLAEDENSYKAYKKHWEAILKNRKIETLFDVSIGSGSVTLPAAELGIRLTGSDLSESMLANCRKKANTKQNWNAAILGCYQQSFPGSLTVLQVRGIPCLM